MPVRQAILRVAWNEFRPGNRCSWYGVNRRAFAGVGAEVAPAGDHIGKKLVLPACSIDRV